MITLEKLGIFLKYRGDVDAFGRGEKKDRIKLHDSDFYLISNLLSDLRLVNGNYASIEYAEMIERKIKENCDGEITIKRLREISNM